MPPLILCMEGSRWTRLSCRVCVETLDYIVFHSSLLFLCVNVCCACEPVVITVSCLKFRTLHAMLLGFRLEDLKAVSASFIYNMSCHLIERQDSPFLFSTGQPKFVRTHTSPFSTFFLGLIQTLHFPPIRYAVGWPGLSQEPTFSVYGWG